MSDVTCAASDRRRGQHVDARGDRCPGCVPRGVRSARFEQRTGGARADRDSRGGTVGHHRGDGYGGSDASGDRDGAVAVERGSRRAGERDTERDTYRGSGSERDVAADGGCAAERGADGGCAAERGADGGCAAERGADGGCAAERGADGEPDAGAERDPNAEPNAEPNADPDPGRGPDTDA